MLADQLLRRGRVGGELRRIEVPTARDAVNVRLLLAARAGRQFFAFAFGEALLCILAALNPNWGLSVKRVLWTAPRAAGERQREPCSLPRLWRRAAWLCADHRIF